MSHYKYRSYKCDSCTPAYKDCSKKCGDAQYKLLFKCADISNLIAGQTINLPINQFVLLFEDESFGDLLSVSATYTSGPPSVLRLTFNFTLESCYYVKQLSLSGTSETRTLVLLNTVPATNTNCSSSATFGFTITEDSSLLSFTQDYTCNDQSPFLVPLLATLTSSTTKIELDLRVKFCKDKAYRPCPQPCPPCGQSYPQPCSSCQPLL